MSDSRATDSKPRKSTDLEQMIRRAVRAEVLELQIFNGEAQPMRLRPHDADSEQQVLSALVDGAVTPDESGLRAGHFYTYFGQFCFAAIEAVVAAERKPELKHIRAALAAQGIKGERVEYELGLIAFCTPFRVKAHVLQLAERIRDLWRQRQFIDAMDRARAGLDAQTLSFDAAAELITAAIAEARDRVG